MLLAEPPLKMFAPKFKARCPTSGTWSPKVKQATCTKDLFNTEQNNLQNHQTAPTPPPPPIWSPQASPIAGRKEFRPVRFESPTPTRKYTLKQQENSFHPPWSSNKTADFISPKPESPYAMRDSKLNKGVVFAEAEYTRIGDNIKPKFNRPSDKIYTSKAEYESELETEFTYPKYTRTNKMEPKKYDGIGPTTKDGMPIVLRSEVKEPNQHQWYKKMYNTIHKTKDDEYVTVYYKTNRGRLPFKTSGYMSEPEPVYDSDYSSVKYNTLDRRRPNGYHDGRNYGTMPNPSTFDNRTYRIQPGRIENYTPGYSTETRRRQWWDEAMDVFSGQTENRKIHPICTEGNLSRALREQGYQSDSNLVFRKKEKSIYNPLSPVEQKQAYRSVQAGGEPPLQGFRKLAPEKPKDNTGTKCYQTTPTLDKISSYNQFNLTEPQREIICFPITNISRPIDLFAPFPKNIKSFIPINPPKPPNRNSSHNNTTLNFVTKAITSKLDKPKHIVSKFDATTIRKRAKKETYPRSKSAESSYMTNISKTSTVNDSNQNNTTHSSRKEQVLRIHSVSPSDLRKKRKETRSLNRSPIAFGRSISKERTFAEEKKRLEQAIPFYHKVFTPSTNILRDPTLNSSDEVKQAVRSSYKLIPITRSKSASIATCNRSATVLCSKMTQKSLNSNKLQEQTFEHETFNISKTLQNRPKQKSVNVIQKDKLKKTPANSCASLSLARTNSTFSLDSAGTLKKYNVTTTQSKKCSKAIPIRMKKRSKTLNENLNTIIHQTTLPSRSVQEISLVPLFKNFKLYSENNSKLNEVCLRKTNDYISQKKPVKNSKFLSFKAEQKNFHSWNGSTVSSPHLSKHSKTKISHFPPLSNSCKKGHECKRSTSEPRSSTGFNIIYPNTTNVRSFGLENTTTNSSCHQLRSPSRRKIQSFRNSKKSDNSTMLRSCSLGRAERALRQYEAKAKDIWRSTGFLNTIEGHRPLCEHRHFKRFKELKHFYNTLERVAQLEKATSSADLRLSSRSTSEIIDFDLWKKVRAQEKDERELNSLLNKLKQDQEEKGLLFQTKDINDIRWNKNMDSGLRCKQKSIENIRQELETKLSDNIDQTKKLELEYSKDYYKPHWRGNSVIDVASTMTKKYSQSEKENKNHLSQHLMSTLSKEQVEQIKTQLNEIYSNNSKTTKNVPKSSPVFLKESHFNVLKSSSASSIPPKTEQSFKSSETISTQLNESQKRQLSRSLSLEIQNRTKKLQKRQTSPVLLARETRGAVAAEQAKLSLTEQNIKPHFFSLDYTYSEESNIPNSSSKEFIDEKNNLSLYESHLPVTTNSLNENFKESTCIEKPLSSINEKIRFFEEVHNEEPSKTIYRARDDSSLDEEEISTEIKAKYDHPQESHSIETQIKHSELTSSSSDFKELFGEKASHRLNFKFPEIPPPPDQYCDRSDQTNCFFLQSTSHACNCNQSGKTGDVKQITDKFEHLCSCTQEFPIRRIYSDPELQKYRNNSPQRTIIRDHEFGDVSWITHKFEVKNRAARGRCRTRKLISPISKICMKNYDRFMPHIDIISKIASLRKEHKSDMYDRKYLVPSGEVARIRKMFEYSRKMSSDDNMYSSNPDLNHLKNISPYLKANWYAHRYPSPRENSRTTKSLENNTNNDHIKRYPIYRSNSVSPPRTKSLIATILKPYSDIFADQKFNPYMHRPIARYVPNNIEDLWKKVRNGFKKPQTIRFSGNDLLTMSKMQSSNTTEIESPHRYVESDVNIHYKTPIRYEYKEAIPEDELIRSQAETMKTIYQEERRRKYLQELQDINNRRHTDNFTPSQKSPIPLNRYDDFSANINQKSEISGTIIARALYNFQGQTARELTFKKGDIIYIRRQVDKNWYEGEHNAMIGLLPANYIEIITKDGKRQPIKKPSEGQARAKFNFTAQSALELSLNKGELISLTRRVDENWFEGKIANRKGIFPVAYVDVLTDIGSEHYHQTPAPKPVGTPASHSLITNPSNVTSNDFLHTNIYNDLNEFTNGYTRNGTIRETKSLHKTEILHVDTSSEPISYRALYKYRPQNSDELELQEGDIIYVLEKCDDGWFVGTSQRTGCFGTFPGNYVEKL